MSTDWTAHLRRLFRPDAPVAASPASVTTFVQTTAPEAFRTLADELNPFVERVDVYQEEEETGIVLQTDADTDPFTYAVKSRTVRVPNFAFPEINVTDDEPRRHRAEVHVNGNRERKNVAGWSEDALIRDVLTTYEEHVAWNPA
jgi:hypothetical protein